MSGVPEVGASGRKRWKPSLFAQPLLHTSRPCVLPGIITFQNLSASPLTLAHSSDALASPGAQTRRGTALRRPRRGLTVTPLSWGTGTADAAQRSPVGGRPAQQGRLCLSPRLSPPLRLEEQPPQHQLSVTIDEWMDSSEPSTCTKPANSWGGWPLGGGSCCGLRKVTPCQQEPSVPRSAFCPGPEAPTAALSP